MITLKGLLRNRNFIFITALVLGLFFPETSTTMSRLILPALALTMILSTMEIGNDIFRRPRKLILPLIISHLLIWKGWSKKIAPWKGEITNWSFFLALTLFGKEAAIPAAVCTASMIVYIIWLDLAKKG